MPKTHQQRLTKDRQKAAPLVESSSLTPSTPKSTRLTSTRARSSKGLISTTAAAFVASLALPPLAASAQNASTDNPTTSPRDEIPALETVTVTATRLNTDLSEVARSIAVVDRLSIESMQAQSVAQTLMYEANISVAGGPRAANQEVNIRGLTGNKVLQTVDGARQGFESGHRPNFFLDPELLASVEAVRGPVSSLWGSGALGGVIAQRTIRPDDMLRGDANFGGFLKTGFNSNNQQSTTTGALVGRSDSADWLLSAYHRNSDDVELGNGETLQGSASNNQGVLAKYRQRFGEDHAVELIYRGAEFDGAVPSNGTAEINDSSNFLLQREQQTHNASVEYQYTPDSDWVDLRAQAFVNSVRMDENRISDNRADRTELDTVGFNLLNTSRVAGMTLLYGFDSYRESFSADRSGLNRPTPPEAQSDVWSLYTQAQIPFADRWRLDLGIRYDDFETEAENLGERRSDSATSPSAALIFTPSDWATLSLRHDRAFRAPGAEELYSSGAHFCIGPGFCNRFTPNPDLDPERAASTELMARFELAAPFGGDRLVVQTSVFENRVDDFIEQIVAGPFFFGRPDPGTTSWINVEEAKLRGGEISAHYQRDQLSLRLAYGITRGEDSQTGEDLSNIPADTLNADLSYRLPERGLLAGLRLTVSDDQRRTNVPEFNADTRFDGYAIADLYAHWTPQAVSALRFDLNVNNLTDRFYQRAWDQLAQPGREVILSAVYRF